MLTGLGQQLCLQIPLSFGHQLRHYSLSFIVYAASVQPHLLGTAVFEILCNFVLPGVGTLMMKKPIIGILQLLILFVAFVLTVTVFLTFYGLVIWFVDVVWALIVGVLWYRDRKKQDS